MSTSDLRAGDDYPEPKRTKNGFTVEATRQAIAGLDRAIINLRARIESTVTAFDEPSLLDELALAGLEGLRTDLFDQLREVGEEP